MFVFSGFKAKRKRETGWNRALLMYQNVSTPILQTDYPAC